jgi:recombination protein RecA
METSSFLRYNYGIDEIQENFLMAVDFGLIKKAGAWFEFQDKTKMQGLEKARNKLEKEPKLYFKLKEKIKQYNGY